MHGKQLALSFVFPFKSIMQSSQVSCSTNLYHLMAGDRNAAGRALRSSPGGLFWPAYLCSDSIVKMLLFESPFLNITSHFSLSPLSFCGSLWNVFSKMPDVLLWHFPTGQKDHTQTPVHPAIVLTLHPHHGKYSYSTLDQQWYYFSK